MKLGLEIKNTGRAIRPSKNDVILYDGRQWYIITKEELFKEFEERLNSKEKELNNKIEECNAKLGEMNEAKKKNAEQILKIAAVVENFVKEGK